MLKKTSQNILRNRREKERNVSFDGLKIIMNNLMCLIECMLYDQFLVNTIYYTRMLDGLICIIVFAYLKCCDI